MYNTICVTEITTRKQKTGCGSAWLERLVWGRKSQVRILSPRLICGCSSMVEHQPSKLDTWVRFPSPAFLKPESFESGSGKE